MLMERVKLTDVAFFQEGPGVRSFQYKTKGVKLLNVSNLQKGKLVPDTSRRYISGEEAYGKYRRFLVDEGDLIIASSGIKVDLFDEKVCQVKKEQLPLCLNTGTIRFRTIDSGRLDAGYLLYFLKGYCFKQQLSRLITGSAQLNFGPGHLKQVYIPLPGIEVQKRIAVILNRSWELAEKRRVQIELIDNYIRCIFVKIFGDISQSSTVWDIKKLDTLARLITDGIHKKPNYTPSGVPFISVKNISSGEMDFSDCKYISAEDHRTYTKRCKPEFMDVLYTKVGTCGKSAIVDTHRDFSLYVSVSLIKPDNKLINPYYMTEVLRTPFVKSQADAATKGIGVPDLHLTDIRNFNIPVPPLTLQNGFSSVSEKVQKQKKLLYVGLQKLEQNYHALIRKAFNDDLFN